MYDLKTAIGLSSLLIGLATFLYARHAIRLATDLAIHALRSEYSSVKAEVAQTLDSVVTRATYLRKRCDRIPRNTLTGQDSEMLSEAIAELEVCGRVREEFKNGEAPSEWEESIWVQRPTHDAHKKLLEHVRIAREVQGALSAGGWDAQLDGLEEIVDFIEKATIPRAIASKCECHCREPRQ